jgi:sugar (pentulose or hexulose) kinase
MEGAALELRWAVEKMRSAGVEVTALTMVGGAAKSPVWPKIVSSIVDVPVSLPAVRDAAACGAAILAGVGAGLFADAEAGFAAWSGDQTLLQPDPLQRPVYDETFARYKPAIHELGLLSGEP